MADITLTTEGEPPTPGTGSLTIYGDSGTKKLASKDDAGTVTNYGSGGGGGTPGGLTTYVQYNDSGSFGGNAAFVFDASAKQLTLGVVSSATGILALANSASAFLTKLKAGNALAAVTYTLPTNVGAAGTILTDAAGNGVLSWAAPPSGAATGLQTTTVVVNVSSAVAPSAGQVLVATDSTHATWQTSPPAGAAGSDTQIQFNDGGTALGADAGLTYDKTNKQFTFTGNVASGSFNLTAGDGVTVPVVNLGLSNGNVGYAIVDLASVTGSMNFDGPDTSNSGGFDFVPTNNLINLGLPTFRWKTVYGVTVNGTHVVGEQDVAVGISNDTTGVLKFHNDSNTNTTSLQAGAAAAAVTYTLPTNVGASGSVLTDAAGNGTLSWAVPASGLTVGTTPITSGTGSRLLYETSGNKVGEISGATSDGTTLTLVAPILGTPASGTLTSCTGLPPAGVVGTAAILGANTFTALQTITQASANAGILASTGYSLTGSDATTMVNLTGTWNTSGNPAGLFLNITDTASGNTSRFVDIQRSGTSLFAIQKDSVSNVCVNATRFEVSSSYLYTSQAAAQARTFTSAVMALDNNLTALTLASTYSVKWATTTNLSTFGFDTALSRNTAGVVEVNNGTAGTFRDLKARNLISADANGSYIQTPGMAVGSLPASPVRGMRCYVTDSNATSYTLGIGAVVANGGTTVVPVFYDGTNWRIG